MLRFLSTKWHNRRWPNEIIMFPIRNLSVICGFEIKLSNMPKSMTKLFFKIISTTPNSKHDVKNSVWKRFSLRIIVNNKINYQECAFTLIHYTNTPMLSHYLIPQTKLVVHFAHVKLGIVCEMFYGVAVRFRLIIPIKSNLIYLWLVLLRPLFLQEYQMAYLIHFFEKSFTSCYVEPN